MQLQMVCTYHYPITIQGRLATYQTLRSSYSKVQAKMNNKSKLRNEAGYVFTEDF